MTGSSGRYSIGRVRLTGLFGSPGERRDWLRHAWSGNPWSYETPDRELAIAPIVSPLRFDISVRLDFLRFYQRSRELYREDFGRFADAAREHDYFVWFKKIMCVNWQPHVLADEATFARAWEQRLRATAALVESFEQRGFDTRFPVTLYAGERVLETGTSKRVAREVYAGDGNHRMAMLIAGGQSTLQPGQYRIKRFRRLRPNDTTPELLRLLRVSEDAYLEFLRQGYDGVRIERRDGRIEVEPAGTAAEAELRTVLRVDQPLLRGTPS
jgi:hypothetical protein